MAASEPPQGAGGVTSDGDAAARTSVTDHQRAAILERISDAFVALDREWRYTYVNEKAGRLFGRRPEELVGKHIWTEFPEGKGQPFHQAYERAMAEQIPISLEEHYAPWGRWYENRIYPAPDGLAIYFTDITDRKTAEANLRASEERFAKAFRSSPLGMAVSTLAGGRFLEVNEAFVRMFGVQREAVVGHNSGELKLPVDPMPPDELVRAVRKDGALHGLEYPFLKASGETGWAHCAVEQIDLGGEACLVRFYEDITARKQAEALVTGQKQVLELVASGAPLTQTLTALVRLVEAHAPGMLGSVLLLDEDNVCVRHGAAPSLPMEFVAAVDGQPIGPSAGSCGTAAYRREAVFVEDIATDPLWAAYRAAALPHGLRACWSTPVFDEQRRVLGTFAMYYRHPGLPLAEHRRLIDIATHTAAIAISRHRTERALRAKSEELDKYFDNSLDLLCIADTDGVFRRLNPEWERTLGHPVAELTGRRFLDLVHPDDVGATLAALQKQSSNEHVLNFVNRYKHRDGTYRWIEWRSYAADRLIYAVARDVTDRRQAEAALRESEAQFREAFYRAGVGKVQAEPVTGRFLRVNPAFCEFVGYTDAELIGMTFGDLTLPEDRQADAAPYERLLRGEIPAFARERRHVRKDGTVVWGLVSVTMLFDKDGRASLASAVVQDVTARRLAEEALRQTSQQLRALAARFERVREEESTRIARAVHDELGQMLTGLKLDLRWIERGLEDLSGVSAAGALLDKAVAASALVDDTVRTVQRIAAELRPVVLDKLGLLAALRHEGRQFQQRTGLPCLVRVPDADPQLTPAAANACYRILQEALTNVIRHAQATMVQVEVRAEGGWLTLEVRDNGRGMTGHEAGGPALLGLLGMSERAAAVGGEVSIRGDPGRGTAVVARVPLEQSDGCTGADEDP